MQLTFSLKSREIWDAETPSQRCSRRISLTVLESNREFGFDSPGLAWIFIG
jgi:hypothetical protein